MYNYQIEKLPPKSTDLRFESQASLYISVWLTFRENSYIFPYVLSSSIKSVDPTGIVCFYSKLGENHTYRR